MSTQQGAEKTPTLNEMLDDPTKLPEDTEALVNLVEKAALEGGDPADTDDGTKADAEAKAKADADAKAKADADAKAKADEDAKAKAEEERKATEAAAAKAGKPDGVLLKDGKTVIPYETLSAARRTADEERHAREAAEKAKQEAEQRVAELTAEIERTKKGGAGDPDSEAKTTALKERVAALKNDVPEVGEVFDQLLEHVDSLTKNLGELRGMHEDRERREQHAARDRVQETIDRNPTLRYWQNEKPDLFNEAAALDKQLRQSPNPKIQGMDMDQRFAKVVEMMETVHGTTELPAGYKPAAAPAAAPAKADDKATGGDKGKDVKAGIEAKDPTLTLSDLPGGAAPSSGQKAIEEMTTGDIEASVDRMLDKGMSIQDILANYR